MNKKILAFILWRSHCKQEQNSIIKKIIKKRPKLKRKRSQIDRRFQLVQIKNVEKNHNPQNLSLFA